MSIHARTIPEKPHQEPPHQRKLPKDLSDRELNAKLCRDVAGGCAQCGVLDMCQYGKEYRRRQDSKC